MIFSKAHSIQGSGIIEGVFISSSREIGDFQFSYDTIMVIDGVKYSMSTNRAPAILAGDNVKFLFLSASHDNKVVSLINLSNGSAAESVPADFYPIGIFLLVASLVFAAVAWPQIELTLVFTSLGVVASYLVLIGWRVKKASKLLAAQKS